MWVAWGIVQAHVPGLPDFDALDKQAKQANASASNPSAAAAELDSATAEMQAEAEAEEKKAGAGIVSEKAEEQATGDNKTQAEQDADLFKPQDEEEFDYLAYANDRAMFVWGDAIRMGIVRAEDVPEELRSRAKVVEY
jgi:choline kinase